MAACRWGDEKTFKFIELYRAHDCLWNALNPHYKNNIKRNNAYLDLIANVDPTLTIKTVKAKIKNLRTVYHSEVKKIEDSKRSGSGTKDVYLPSVPWFNEMDAFLKDMGKYRETIESASNDSSNDSQQIGHVNDSTHDHDDDTLTMPVLDNLPSPNQRTALSDGPIKRKRKMSEQPMSLALERLENISAAINKPAEYDEFHFFGLNVAAQLRALPLYESFDIQTEIQTILAAARRRHLQVLPTYSTDTPSITSTFRNPGTQTLTSTRPAPNIKTLSSPTAVTKVTPSTSTQITSTFRKPGTQTLTSTRPAPNIKALSSPTAVTKVTPSTSTQITSTFRKPGTQTLTSTGPASITKEDSNYDENYDEYLTEYLEDFV